MHLMHGVRKELSQRRIMTTSGLLSRMNKHIINIHKILFVFSAVLTGVLIFGGLDEVLDYWPLLWIVLGMDAYLLGYAAEFLAGLFTERYLNGEAVTITVGILTCIPGLPGLYLLFFGKGWDDLTAYVLLFFFSLPLLITTVVCLIMCLVRRRRLK